MGLDRVTSGDTRCAVGCLSLAHGLDTEDVASYV